MKTTKLIHLPLALLLSSLCFAQLTAAPLGTAFTYQGQLTAGTNGANGSFDFRFDLFDAISGGNHVASTVTNNSTAVSNGLFIATLDFGAGIFTGTNYWLQIGVQTNGGTGFTTLTPRQSLTPSPYALYASTANAAGISGTLPPASLVGIYGNQVTLSNTANQFAGDGSGLTGVNAGTLGGLGASSFWQLGGNAGTTAGVNFVGTTDNQPLELRINNQRTFRFESAVGGPNIIGGSSGNYVSNAIAATISGGGPGNVVSDSSYSVVAGGSSNQIPYGDFSAISGGSGNSIGKYDAMGEGHYAFIGGGSANSIVGGNYATVAGGSTNRIRGGGPGPNDFTTIGGGAGNDIEASESATIGGGERNSIYALPAATIGGGLANTNQGGAGTIGGGAGNRIAGDYDQGIDPNYPTIGGGAGNLIDILCDGTTIAGGVGNTITFQSPGLTVGTYATIAGGISNLISASFATIGGGVDNVITNQTATIAGGSGNLVGGAGSCIGGGGTNQTFAYYSTIGGGIGNQIEAPFVLFAPYAVGSTIAGGVSNTIEGPITGNGGANKACTISGGMSNLIDNSVANCSFSTISGGEGNEITTRSDGAPDHATIGGGGQNIIMGPYSTVGGGFSNVIMDASSPSGPYYTTIAGGSLNFAAGVNGTIGGGNRNVIQSFCDSGVISGGIANAILSGALNGTIGGGGGNTVSGQGGTVGGGVGNSITSAYGTVPGGTQAKSSNYGQQAYASGGFTTAGDAQTSIYVCRASTTNATQTELFLDGASQRMLVATNSTWCFDIIVTGRASDGTSAAYQLLGEIKNNGGTTTFGSAVKQNILAEDNATWDATAAPDSGNQALVVRVTGSNGASIHWVASVRTVEVMY